MTNPTPIEFWFDFSSPYSYLASEKIDDLAARFKRRVQWRPMMLGAAFKATGSQPLLSVPLKGEYSRHDLERSARYLNVPYRLPSRFPAITLTAARAYYWLHSQDCEQARRFAQAVFRAYWVHDRDIEQIEVVAALAMSLNIDATALTNAVQQQEWKDKLRFETEGVVARGMFGAPFFFIDNEPFWGVDRLPQMERWLEGLAMGAGGF